MKHKKEKELIITSLDEKIGYKNKNKLNKNKDKQLEMNLSWNYIDKTKMKAKETR